MNREIEGWRIPKRNRHVSEKLGRIALLFDITTGRLYELNETGKILWSLCDGKHKVDDMERILREQYYVSEDNLKEDVLSFLKKLQELNLIRFHEK